MQKAKNMQTIFLIAIVALFVLSSCAQNTVQERVYPEADARAKALAKAHVKASEQYRAGGEGLVVTSVEPRECNGCYDVTLNYKAPAPGSQEDTNNTETNTETKQEMSTFTVKLTFQNWKVVREQVFEDGERISDQSKNAQPSTQRPPGPPGA